MSAHDETRAAEAIYKRVAQLAPSASIKELGELADAVSKVAYGPQGGILEKDTHERYEGDILNRYPSRDGSAGFTSGGSPDARGDA